LIGTLSEHLLADDAFARLCGRLAARRPDEIIAFADHLARALHALDTPAHFAAVRPYIAGDDSFLYIRCAVVAAGGKTAEHGHAEPESAP
jgi:hypothetical protein